MAAQVSNDEGLRFYERHGFKVRARSSRPQGSIWGMTWHGQAATWPTRRPGLQGGLAKASWQTCAHLNRRACMHS